MPLEYPNIDSRSHRTPEALLFHFRFSNLPLDGLDFLGVLRIQPVEHVRHGAPSLFTYFMTRLSCLLGFPHLVSAITVALKVCFAQDCLSSLLVLLRELVLLNDEAGSPYIW
jgi:hypothetical protein